MNYKEIDSRSTPLRTICTVATNAIDELFHFSRTGLLDEKSALEYAEYFYGTVLVACQAYAVGTVSDYNETNNADIKKLTLYKHSETCLNEHTRVELINALANFLSTTKSGQDGRKMRQLKFYVFLV